MRKKQKQKREKANWERRLLQVVFRVGLFLQCAFYAMPVHAGALKDTTLVSGTEALLKDGRNVLIGFVAIVAGVVELIIGLQYMQADEQEQPKYRKRAKTTIIVAICCVCATAIIEAILSYYLVK